MLSKCALCNEKRLKENLLAEFNHWFLTFNRYPYLPGHLLLLPNDEVGTLYECSDEAQLEFGHILGVCQKVLMDAVGSKSCNVGINTGVSSGASIPEHLHVHLVPRHSNDINFILTCSERNEKGVVPRESIQFFDNFGRIRNKIINAFITNIDERLSNLKGYKPNNDISRASSDVMA